MDMMITMMITMIVASFDHLCNRDHLLEMLLLLLLLLDNDDNMILY